ncbi:hypothetical protein C8J57DRAFT_1545936 [Mycena rebaudengoi]|nr:hypothetical protein C8J57DRAFT_1545936 [Mycena rebaudengoi]
MHRFLPRKEKQSLESLLVPESPSVSATEETTIPNAVDDGAPPRKKPRIEVPQMDLKREEYLHKGFTHEMRNAVDKARQHTRIFSSFSFAWAFDNKPQLDSGPLPAVNWLDDQPRCAVSNDRVPLVFHIPGAIGRAGADLLLQQLVDFGSDVNVKLPKCTSADGQTRCAINSYHNFAGQVAGLFKLVRAWHAIGHTTSHAFACSMELVHELRLLSHHVNDLILFADPAHYAALKSICAEAEHKYKFVKVLGSHDPLMMEGCEIIFNRQMPLHTDRPDPNKGWAVLVVLGHFKGGPLCIPALNLRLQYMHRDMIMGTSSPFPPFPHRSPSRTALPARFSSPLPLLLFCAPGLAILNPHTETPSEDSTSLLQVAIFSPLAFPVPPIKRWPSTAIVRVSAARLAFVHGRRRLRF